MIIDLTHPLAQWLIVLRDGEPVGFVQRLDTNTKRCWTTDRAAMGPSPEELPVIEGRFDELRYLPHLPSHLRAFVPAGLKPYAPRD